MFSKTCSGGSSVATVKPSELRRRRGASSARYRSSRSEELPTPEPSALPIPTPTALPTPVPTSAPTDVCEYYTSQCDLCECKAGIAR